MTGRQEVTVASPVSAYGVSVPGADPASCERAQRRTINVSIRARIPGKLSHVSYSRIGLTSMAEAAVWADGIWNEVERGGGTVDLVLFSPSVPELAAGRGTEQDGHCA